LITTDQLLYGYTKGIFPMADPDNHNLIEWFEPKIRGVIFLDECTIPKSVQKVYKQQFFECRINTAFDQVIHACADRAETWISDEIIDIYCELHKLGYAYSFETWKDGELAGGLYGVSMNRIFFGESMFHYQTNASKVALTFLINTLIANNYLAIDTQFITSHLKQFGAREITRNQFLELLALSL